MIALITIVLLTARPRRSDHGCDYRDRLTSEEFNPEDYKDEYRVRVLGTLDEKNKGKGIVVDKAPSRKHSQVIDIMEALKRSMQRVPAKRNPQSRQPLRRKRKCPMARHLNKFRKELSRY